MLSKDKRNKRAPKKWEKHVTTWFSMKKADSTQNKKGRICLILCFCQIQNLIDVHAMRTVIAAQGL